MRSKSPFILLSFLVCITLCSQAQLWNGVISPNRAVDWSNAGIPGGIPNRTTICATLSPGATSSQINSAIASCPAGQVVKLNAGTYNLTAGVDFAGKSNVTLRGAGPDKTFLVFTGDTACQGLQADVCIQNTRASDVTNPAHSANWTAGYAKGSTSITLSSTTGLVVGDIVILDQLNDSNTDTGAIWVCETGGVCASEGPAGGARSNRSQQQIVKVTGISGSTVSISPGLYMPNWRASQSPAAFWANTPIKNSGIEDMSLDHTNGGMNTGIGMLVAYNCWVKDVRSLNSNRNHIWVYQTAASVIRDSYFYGTQNSQSQSYGIESYMSSDNLIENNIFQHIVGGMVGNASQSGSVFGYNFEILDYYTPSPSFMQASNYMHAAGIDNVLHEGNVAPGLKGDVVHGTHHFVTAFRNYFVGWESGKSSETVPIMLEGPNRYYNIVGNVLGKQGYHNNYQCVPSSTTTSNCSLGDTSIYDIGWSGLGGSGSSLPNDLPTNTTLMRWGNYDVVSAANRFVSSEVPSGIGSYANPVPASQSLPASMYLTGKPSWWPASKPWPAIGPDVSGGNIAGLNGHAYTIPAQDCFTNVMGGSADGTGSALTFNANNCYASTGTTGPNPPTGVTAVVK